MLCDCAAACGERLNPALCHLLLDQLLQKGWVAFCLCPVALAVQKMRPLQVVIVKVVLALGPLHAGRNFIQDACWDALFHKICELCIGVLHAGGKSLQEAEAERLSGRHEKAVSLRARRAQAFMCDLCQIQLLLLRERVRVGALSQMAYDVWGELMLGCVLVPVLNDVLKGAAGFGAGVICCASEAGAVADWRPAVHDGFAEQVGKI